MGNLIVKHIEYSGDTYYYNSPALEKGINIILGDNGSGKSTFSYFIEFAFGGKIKPFINDPSGGKYKEIILDKNNYVQATIEINGSLFLIKRFFNTNDIFVSEGDKVKVFPIYREKKVAPYIFSDWLLDKLGIPLFEINLGTSNWFFNFSDLFRLLNYDQDTDPKKIYKAPIADNYISDSAIIRKSIFEILLGISSADYFKKLDDLKRAMRLRDEAKALFENFKTLYGQQIKDLNKLSNDKADLEEQLVKLVTTRNQYLEKSTTVNDKIGELSEIQNRLVTAELEISSNTIKLKDYISEKVKIRKLLEDAQKEIEQIKKIIFTHEKLDLFSMEICPFCMDEKKDIEQGFCICGSKFKDDDYEKFVYNSSEYNDILQHKQKSINAILIAEEYYNSEELTLKRNIALETMESQNLKDKLNAIVKTATFSGNTFRVDELNRKIIEVKENMFQVDNLLKINTELKVLEDSYIAKKITAENADRRYRESKILFDTNNSATIESFNEVYNELLSLSSYQSQKAQIDEDYMPIIDDGVYKAKSLDVPRRLMYYFTILSLSLKLNSVKHPRFLLIDTPENSGIDTDHLKEDLLLLDKALELSKNTPGDSMNDFQVILTTGYGKFPDTYEKYIKEVFNKKEDNFILKKKLY